MPNDNKTMHLHAKYMALAHSSSENDRLSARESAKQILKLPIRNARDLNTKLKVLETEISDLKGINAEARFRLLELLALTAQAEFKIDEGFRLQLSQTKH